MAFPKPFFKWRPHPWHGLEVGDNVPEVVNAFIEMTPFDSVKYEVDKQTGYVRVDRPQRTSSQPPMLYGFIPRTYCGKRVSELSPKSKVGDHDPLDICVLSERPINKSEIILRARIIGGIQMIDHDEADDKIFAVLENDNMWGGVRSIKDLPEILVERLKHYFATYKYNLGQELNVSIEKVYDYEHAFEVVKASMQDYDDEFGNE